jgi:DNA-binding response OmpR family regulator
MSERILVVEGQEDLRAILRDFLSASDYTVIEAVDGSAASRHSRRAWAAGRP